MACQSANDKEPVVLYSMSTDGIGGGSGGISFQEFAYFHALEKGHVRPEGMDLEIVGRPGGRPVMNDLLVNREVDIGVISLATAIRKHDEGLGLRVLCKEKRFEGGGNSVYVRAASKIRTAGDLGSAKGINFHCPPDSERLIVQQGILEKKYGLKWTDLPKVEGS